MKPQRQSHTPMSTIRPPNVANQFLSVSTAEAIHSPQSTKFISQPKIYHEPRHQRSVTEGI
jgi:hypothetical protein